MLDNLLAGILLFASWDVLAVIMIGMPIGLVFGLLPGLSGFTALAILIPFVYGMEPFAGLAFLISAHAVIATSGAITSILIGIPGEPSNAATVFDGYPLAKKGKGGFACGAALFSSGVGGVIGCLVLALLLPMLQPVIMAIGTPEMFILVLIGLMFLASIGSRTRASGLVVGMAGIFISLVGYEDTTGIPRFWFGSEYLLDGFRIIPIALGLFAIPEILQLISHGQSIARSSDDSSLTQREIWRGAGAVLTHWKITVGSSILGALIGMLPGIGGATAQFIAYGTAQKMSRTPEEFGKGSIEGVIAPEATNNAKEGGNLIPTLALGIPGSSSMAILLGAFIVLGVQPGPEFLRKHTDMGMGLAVVLGVVNVVAALLCMVIMPIIARVTLVPGRILAPLLLASVVLGAYTSSNDMADVIAVMAFGVLGYVMLVLEYSRAAFLLGLVLGSEVERYFMLSTNLYGSTFLLRPITLSLIAATAVFLLWPTLRRSFRRLRYGQA